MADARRRDMPTISDIAAELGVSRATVSRAFGRPDLLSKETVERVKAVAVRLGYVPNQTARALSTGRQGNVAIILPDIANPFFPPLVRAAQRIADAAGFGVFIGDSDEDPDQEYRLASRLAPQIEGFVLASSRMSEQQISALAQVRPVVLINRDVTGLSRVLIDPSVGLEQALSALCEMGHTRIAYVAGPSVSWSDQQRRLSLTDASRRLDVTIEVLEKAADGRDAARRLIATETTAAIAFDDFVAHGLLAGLAEQGIAVPAEFSLIGFDDVLGAATHPALSSVFAPGEEAGRRAIRLLLEQLEGNRSEDRRDVLPTRYINRATTGVLSAAQARPRRD